MFVKLSLIVLYVFFYLRKYMLLWYLNRLKWVKIEIVKKFLEIDFF